MIRQIFIVSALNFRNLGHRFWQSMVIVVGLALTVGVLLSMMSLSAGILQTGYLSAGDSGRAIVVSTRAHRAKPQSSITRAMRARLIMPMRPASPRTVMARRWPIQG